MSLHYNHAPQISEIQIQSYELKKQKQKHKTTDFLNHWEGRKNIEGIQFDGRKKNTVQGYIHSKILTMIFGSRSLLIKTIFQDCQ